VLAGRDIRQAQFTSTPAYFTRQQLPVINEYSHIERCFIGTKKTQTWTHRAFAGVGDQRDGLCFPGIDFMEYGFQRTIR